MRDGNVSSFARNKFISLVSLIKGKTNKLGSYDKSRKNSEKTRCVFDVDNMASSRPVDARSYIFIHLHRQHIYRVLLAVAINLHEEIIR